ncbi:MAG: MFS transporter [Pseudomonadota bacterium]
MTRSNRRHRALLFAVVLLDLVGFGIIIPILPFVAPKLGASEFDIALIIASYSLFAGVVGPWWGRLSDRFGRKPILMICTSGSALAYAALAFADHLLTIYLARILAGIVAGNFAVASAIMTDITAPTERAKGMGLIGAAFGMGLVLGPVMGGLLSTPDGGFTLPCLMASIMSVLAVLCAWVFLPESNRSHSGERNAHQKTRDSLPALLRAHRSRLLLLQFVLHTSCVSAATYLFPLWVSALLGWGAREVGIIYGIQGAIMALTQGLFLSFLVQFFGEVRLLRICVSLFFAGFFVAVFATDAVTMVGSALVSLSGATLCMPVLNSLLSQRAPPEQTGRFMGAASSAAAWGRVLGPVLAGLLLSGFGFAPTWAVFTGFVGVYVGWAFSPAPTRSRAG